MATDSLPNWKNSSIQIVSSDSDPGTPFKTGSKWHLVHVNNTNSIILIPENWNEENVELYTNIIPYEYDDRIMIQYNDGFIIHTAIGIITNIDLFKILNGSRLMVFANKDVLINTMNLMNQFDHMENIYHECLTDGFFGRYERNYVDKTIMQDGRKYEICIDEIFLDSIFPLQKSEIVKYIHCKYGVITENEDNNNNIFFTNMFEGRKWIYRYIEIRPKEE